MVGQAVSIGGNASYVDPPLCKSLQARRLGEDELTLYSSFLVRKGNLGSVGMILMEAIATIGLYFYLRYRNQVKEREADTLEAQAKRPISLDVIGDAHPGIFSL